mmetsp:Transcript_13071/g.27643  ORF Transcript_13071/g.27643 Transcript_13071/m.27643 type:complete len:629 (-) Transcript_13071:64-1950(-)|eukprot:CAMPEP_0118926202 /NCGR_PEP_ID=MMETSP1169-20130426/3953_1 /TAXON_ID=36882 /ORGANISM="Pyramimonas obovata, Strain CCMP722" /LENGTH=628 /DNA_ID=CAMNT_0006867705 /DNA_START=266 /DNA_END=2152 /DNA_ORIENTATION=+
MSSASQYLAPVSSPPRLEDVPPSPARSNRSTFAPRPSPASRRASRDIDGDASVKRKSTQGSRRRSYQASESGSESQYLEANVRRETQLDHDGVPVIFEAARRGHRQLVLKLIEEGEDVNLLDFPEYETPLHLAAASNDELMIQALIQAGAHTEARDKEDLTPLHWASEKGSYNAVKVLLEAGADQNAIDLNNSTPMHWAAQRGHLKIVRELINHGAFVNVQDDVMRTPLQWASQEGFEEVVVCLLENSADFSFRDQWGHTALHDAACSGKAKVVELLIKNGADVLARDNDGYIPRDVALGEGYSNVVDVMDGIQWEFLAKNDPRPAAPGQPLVEEGEDIGTVVVTWNPPLPTKHAVTGYEVQISADGGDQWMRFGFTNSVNDISMEKGKLKEGKTYLFRVHARNAIDNWGPFGQVSVPYLVPSPRLTCFPIMIQSGAFAFMWSIPDGSEAASANSNALLFEVEIADSKGTRVMANERTQKRYVKVVNLSASTEYAARVAMSNVNDHQWGDWSDVMHVSTLSVGAQAYEMSSRQVSAEDMHIIDLRQTDRARQEEIQMDKKASTNFAHELGMQSAWRKWNALPFYFRMSLILLVAALVCFLDSGLFAIICSVAEFSSQTSPVLSNAKEQ